MIKIVLCGIFFIISLLVLYIGVRKLEEAKTHERKARNLASEMEFRTNQLAKQTQELLEQEKTIKVLERERLESANALIIEKNRLEEQRSELTRKDEQLTKRYQEIHNQSIQLQQQETALQQAVHEVEMALNEKREQFRAEIQRKKNEWKQSALNQKLELEKLAALKRRLDTAIAALEATNAQLEQENQALQARSLALYSESLITTPLEDAPASEYKETLRQLTTEFHAYLLHKGVLFSHEMPESVQLRFKKKILFAFNAEVKGLLLRLTRVNVDQIRQAIIMTYEKINDLYQEDGIALERKVLTYALKQVELNHAYQVAKSQSNEQ